jgi:hypothetical protein
VGVLIIVQHFVHLGMHTVTTVAPVTRTGRKERVRLFGRLCLDTPFLGSDHMQRGVECF